MSTEPFDQTTLDSDAAIEGALDKIMESALDTIAIALVAVINDMMVKTKCEFEVTAQFVRGFVAGNSISNCDDYDKFEQVYDYVLPKVLEGLGL